MGEIGRTLLILGVALVAVGALFVLFERLGLPRLPGDLVWRGERTTLVCPLATSLLLSVVLTVLLNLWLRSR